MYVPDNLDIYDYFEREQVRRERIRRRVEIEEEKESEEEDYAGITNCSQSTDWNYNN